MLFQNPLINHLKNWLCFSLFAVFPILFVYFRNKSFIFEGGLGLPLILVLVSLLLIYLLFNRLNRKYTNNTLICIITAWWFLLYGHIYYSLLDLLQLPYSSFRHRYFLPLYSLLFFFPVLKIWRINTIPDKLIGLFLIIGVCLNLQFLVPMIKGGNVYATSKTEVVQNTNTADMPDVYYIVMDSYPNAGNLLKYYKYDNTPFVHQLQQLGFNVIDKAQSNYPYTYFSIPSTLNMEYINYFEDSVSLAKNNEDFPFTKIRHNKVADYFKQKGYKYVLYASAYEQLNDKSQADLYISNKLSINSFHESLIQLSLLNALNLEFYSQGVYKLCSNSFKLLPNTPKIKGNKFVFFHCLPPHPPHVFDKNGNFIYVDDNVENRYRQKKEYIGQVQFMNHKMIEMIGSIIKDSEQPPVIILQGDHGSASSERVENENEWAKYPSKELLIERFGILNALYIPEKYKIEIPAKHTPVNTFRFILNRLFNDSMEILPSKFYFARYRSPYQFKEVNWPAVYGLTKDSLVSTIK